MADLDAEKDISIQDILINLLDGDNDLELKTEIKAPKDLAGLSILADVLSLQKCTESGQLIKDFLEVYMRLMVSYQRKSRTEIIKAIEGLLDKEAVRMTISDRLTGNLKT